MKMIQIKFKPLLVLFIIGYAFTSCSVDDDTVDTEIPTEIILINENIDVDTVLKNNSPGVNYEICGRIKINARLTIEAGVEIVMCAGSSVSVEKDGSLNAVGTETMPIVFRGKTASPGFWNFLHINSNNPANELNHVIIADAGGNGSYKNASIWVNDNNTGQLTFKNSTIKDSKGYGLFVEGIATIPNFGNNTFSNNGDAPVAIPLSGIGSLDAASNYADGNTKNHIDIYAANMNSPQIVKNINVPFLINGSSNIRENLKLNPGVRFLMASGASLDVNASGSFNAIGTSSEPISIKGEVDAVGYWQILHINSNNPLNEFKYVKIKNGGANGSYKYASIWVNDNNNGTFIMTNSSIADSYGWGLYVEDGATMTPSTKAGVENANSFSNNGSGANSNCTGDCNVYFN